MFGNISIAIVLAGVITLIIGVIEVLYLSKNSHPFVCLTGAFCLYLVVLLFGNVATTLVSHSLIAGYVGEAASEPKVPAAEPGDQSSKNESLSSQTKERDPNATKAEPGKPARIDASIFAAAPWFWSAFLGVFAFEAVLQRINVTFFDKGVLTISDWISKGRDGAVAAAVEAYASHLVRREGALAAKIAASGLTDADLNTYVQNWLGASRVLELEQAAIANHANPRLTKALALAAGAYDRAVALL